MAYFECGINSNFGAAELINFAKHGCLTHRQCENPDLKVRRRIIGTGHPAVIVPPPLDGVRVHA